MQIKRYIATLLFFCFAVYLGHNLVPHQHHSETRLSADTQSCPLGHHDHHNENSGTKHCHAFNDIDFVKKSHVGNPGPVTIHSQFLMADPSSVQDPVEERELSHLFRLKLPILSALCSGPPSLRAPPSVV